MVFFNLKMMANLTENTKRSMFYPFHKDGWKVIKADGDAD